MEIHGGLTNWWENEDAIKENRKLIKQKLKDCLKANGYKQGKSSCFYLFTKDMIVYYKPEHPSIMTYLWFCFYPLYMPPVDLRVFTFGDRLSALTDNYIWNIRDYESDSSMEEWCERIAEIDRLRVSLLIPKLHDISSINESFKEADSLGSREYVDLAGFIRLGIEKSKQIAMFTKLALHQYDKAMLLANYILHAGVNGELRVNQTLSAHCKMVVDLASKHDDELTNKTMALWREENTRIIHR